MASTTMMVGNRAPGYVKRMVSRIEQSDVMFDLYEAEDGGDVPTISGATHMGNPDEKAMELFVMSGDEEDQSLPEDPEG